MTQQEALKHHKNHKHSFLTFALIQEEQLLLRGTAATTMLTHAHPLGDPCNIDPSSTSYNYLGAHFNVYLKRRRRMSY